MVAWSFPVLPPGSSRSLLHLSCFSIKQGPCQKCPKKCFAVISYDCEKRNFGMRGRKTVRSQFCTTYQELSLKRSRSMMQNCDIYAFSCNFNLRFPVEREPFLKGVFISLISCLKKAPFGEHWDQGVLFVLQFCDNKKVSFVKKRIIEAGCSPGTVGKNR